MKTRWMWAAPAAAFLVAITAALASSPSWAALSARSRLMTTGAGSTVG
jgi:hypothetical protein